MNFEDSSSTGMNYTKEESTLMTNIKQVKDRALKWQEAFFSIVDAFLKGSINVFYLLDSSISNNDNNNNNHRFTASALFFRNDPVHNNNKDDHHHDINMHESDKPVCLLVGVNKLLLTRLMTLGARPYTLEEPIPGNSKKAGVTSTSGLLEASRLGQSVCVCGRDAISIAATCLLGKFLC